MIGEYDRLAIEGNLVEIILDQKEQVLRMAAEPAQCFVDTPYEDKRLLMDILDVQCIMNWSLVRDG